MNHATDDQQSLKLIMYMQNPSPGLLATAQWALQLTVMLTQPLFVYRKCWPLTANCSQLTGAVPGPAPVKT